MGHLWKGKEARAHWEDVEYRLKFKEGKIVGTTLTRADKRYVNVVGFYDDDDNSFTMSWLHPTKHNTFKVRG